MKKTKRLGLILTEKEKEWVIRLAELEGGLSQAALIRRLIRQKALEYELDDMGRSREGERSPSPHKEIQGERQF